MNTNNWFVKSKYFKISIPQPFTQALGILCISIIMMPMGLILGEPSFSWTVSGAFLLFFIVFNNALGIFAADQFKYIQYSVYSFMGLLVVLGLLSYLISGISIFGEKGVNRTIYLVLILANFSLLGLAFMVRSIADFLQKRDEKLHKNGKL